MKKYLLLFVFLLASCNVYAPLTKNSSPTDYIESARKCEQNGDFGCAITNYLLLPPGDQQNQLLCKAYLAQGGITLIALTSIVNQNAATMLGSLAQTLVPWSTTTYTAFQNAVTSCTTYATSASSGDLGILLNALARIGDCANRIAQTNICQATADTDAATACTVVGPSTGTIIQADISDASGNISAASPGMSGVNAQACTTDIAGINTGDLTNAGLTQILTAYNAIPASLKNSGAAANVIRLAIRATLTN